MKALNQPAMSERTVILRRFCAYGTVTTNSIAKKARFAPVRANASLHPSPIAPRKPNKPTAVTDIIVIPGESALGIVPTTASAVRKVFAIPVGAAKPSRKSDSTKSRRCRTCLVLPIRNANPDGTAIMPDDVTNNATPKCPVAKVSFVPKKDVASKTPRFPTRWSSSRRRAGVLKTANARQTNIATWSKTKTSSVFANLAATGRFRIFPAVRECSASRMADVLPVLRMGVPEKKKLEPLVAIGGACEQDEQCMEGTFCKDGICSKDCHPGANLCGLGQTCDPLRGRCVDDPEAVVPVAEAEKQIPTLRWESLMHRGCRLAKDCPINSVCQDGVCTFECLSDEDCGLPGTAYCSCSGQCVEGARTTQGCSYTEAKACNRNDECPEGAACSGGQCRYVCLSRLGGNGRMSSWGCKPEETCDMQARRCVPAEPDKPVRLKLTWPRCGADNDCPAPTRCLLHLGLCSAECLRDEHCDAGFTCGPRGLCHEATKDFGTQQYPRCKSDAQCQAGSYCAAGICRMDCVAGVPALDCPEGQACTKGGRCIGEASER